MKMVENFVTLMGRPVREGGSGIDSIKVSLSRGSVARRGAGRSMGEHAIRTCRR